MNAEQVADYMVRLHEAASLLDSLTGTSHAELMRLRGKAEGVRLAIDYLRAYQ